MNKSFTLIEILVVIVIVGILSAFIIVSMAGVSSKAAIAKGQAFSNSIKNSLMMSLVSEWRLDDASGTTIQDQWGTNPGTWYGSGGGDYTSPSWRTSSECVSNGCLAFDGTDDYVDCGSGNSLDIVNAITISAWTKTSNSFYNTVVHRGNNGWGSGYWLCVRSGSTTDNRFGIQGVDNGSWGTYPDDGQWHNVVGIYSKSEGKIKVYLDGINKLNKAVGGTPAGFSGQNLLIGLVDLPQYPFNGLMDDVRIYNAAVPASQIQQNYYAGLNWLLVKNQISGKDYGQRLAFLD